MAVFYLKVGKYIRFFLYNYAVWSEEYKSIIDDNYS